MRQPSFAGQSTCSEKTSIRSGGQFQFLNIPKNLPNLQKSLQTKADLFPRVLAKTHLFSRIVTIALSPLQRAALVALDWVRRSRWHLGFRFLFLFLVLDISLARCHHLPCSLPILVAGGVMAVAIVQLVTWVGLGLELGLIAQVNCYYYYKYWDGNAV